jgi:hypothetical protein
MKCFYISTFRKNTTNTLMYCFSLAKMLTPLLTISAYSPSHHLSIFDLVPIVTFVCFAHVTPLFGYEISCFIACFLPSSLGKIYVTTAIRPPLSMLSYNTPPFFITPIGLVLCTSIFCADSLDFVLMVLSGYMRLNHHISKWPPVQMGQLITTILSHVWMELYTYPHRQ